LSYRYDPGVFVRTPDVRAETVYIVGGLYGNEQALDTVAEMCASESGAMLVFNGDFNWFNAERESFVAVNRRVLEHRATRGNVETEIAAVDEQAGCGCAYPEWVGDAEVERSNRIMTRLRAMARTVPDVSLALAALPMHLVAEVGASRVAIVHGDLESLAGWDLAQEHADDDARRARIARQMARADVRIVASSHTCLPVALPLAIDGRQCAVMNNGAAGMPNFKSTRFGVITRVSVRPAPNFSPLYSLRIGSIYAQALPVHYDHERFLRAFESCWTVDSPAHLAYFRRIVDGPNYSIDRALRRSASYS
jgi:hypothetical protein